MTKPPISEPIETTEAETPGNRIVIFTFCVAVPFAPTDEQNKAAMLQLIRVATEGMKMNVITAQVVCMTEEQARKNFEKAELDDAIAESKRTKPS